MSSPVYNKTVGRVEQSMVSVDSAAGSSRTNRDVGINRSIKGKKHRLCVGLHQANHLVDDDIFETLAWFLDQFGVQPDAAGRVMLR
jgi:hypothetical protein